MAIKEIAASVECTALSSAKTALTQLETHALTTDLIFLDLNMPIMTGQQFLSELKKRQELNTIPVIILSTSSNTTTINETKALGAKKFITKPSNYKELKSILYGILE